MRAFIPQATRSVVAFAVAVASLLVTAGSAAAAPGDWPQYLAGPAHQSFAGAETAITTANAATLAAAWTWNPPVQAGDAGVPKLDGSPTIVGGRLYIGAADGWFYELDATTGATVAQRNLGFVTACGSRQGIASTATVVPDDTRGGALTAYVTAGAPGGSTASGDYLWALDAATLAPVASWPTNPVVVDAQAGSYAWASPTVVNGRVDVGISSRCDKPLVRGGVKSFAQADGTLQATYWSVPATRTNGTANTGGTIWTTPAGDSATDAIYAVTGNADEDNLAGHGCNCARPGDSYAIVRLNGSTLAKSSRWVDGTAATNAADLRDQDFGGSPTLFQGLVNGVTTPLVGACNKDGRYFALRRSNLGAGPVWSFTVGGDNAETGGFDACLSAVVFDRAAHQLVIGGNRAASVDGRAVPGSVRALSPDAGAASRVLWDDGLACNVIGTPSENGNGLVAVATNGSWSNGSGTFRRCSAAIGRVYGPQCSDTDGKPHVYVLDGRHPVANANGRPDAPVLWCRAVPGGAYSQPVFAGGSLFVASGPLPAIPATATPRITAYRAS